MAISTLTDAGFAMTPLLLRRFIRCLLGEKMSLPTEAVTDEGKTPPVVPFTKESGAYYLLSKMFERSE